MHFPFDAIIDDIFSSMGFHVGQLVLKHTMMETIRNDVHRCEGYCDAMGHVVLFLCLSVSVGC